MTPPVTIEFWVEPLFNCIGIIDLCLCGAEWKSKIWHHHIHRPPWVLVFILCILGGVCCTWDGAHYQVGHWSASLGKQQVLPVNICDFFQEGKKSHRGVWEAEQWWRRGWSNYFSPKEQKCLPKTFLVTFHCFLPHSFHIIMWSNVLGWHDSRLVQS